MVEGFFEYTFKHMGTLGLVQIILLLLLFLVWIYDIYNIMYNFANYSNYFFQGIETTLLGIVVILQGIKTFTSKVLSIPDPYGSGGQVVSLEGQPKATIFFALLTIIIGVIITYAGIVTFFLKIA